jgi:hypothetical protein
MSPSDTTTVVSPLTESATPDTAPTEAGVTPAEKTFTQADLDRILGERLAKEKTRTADAAAKATAEAERRAAEEQGKFQELYQKTVAELEQERTAKRNLEAAALRREVAAKVNLPSALIDRLHGETPEELEADAKQLMAALPKPTAPNINAGAPAGTPPAGVMSEEERKLRAAALGVDWRYFNP